MGDGNQSGIDSTLVLSAIFHAHHTYSSGTPYKTASVCYQFLLLIICHHAENNVTYIKTPEKVTQKPRPTSATAVLKQTALLEV